MGLSLRDERVGGRQGMSLAAVAAHVERAMEEAHRAGVDPDTVEPVVRVTLSGKIKNLETTVL